MVLKFLELGSIILILILFIVVVIIIIIIMTATQSNEVKVDVPVDSSLCVSPTTTKKSSSSSSLLTKALQIPSKDTDQPAFSQQDENDNNDDDDDDDENDLHTESSTTPISRGGKHWNFSDSSSSMFHMGHSDYTIPTSNLVPLHHNQHPPTPPPHHPSYPPPHHHHDDQQEKQEKQQTTPPTSPHRRTVMGKKVEMRYYQTETPPDSPTIKQLTMFQNNNNNLSPLTPARGLILTHHHYHPNQKQHPTSPTTRRTGDRFHHHHHSSFSSSSFSTSLHAQSLLLGIAFMAVWTPNNAMAPNLTEMANDFDMNEKDRDLYLGSYISLALGVFCLPISGLIGFMADFYKRKYLFVACVLGGSVSTFFTSTAQNFTALFWARLSCGGCMSASVPVAFSLLGDLFGVEERNAASSGLTAMMGLGMILGQVYAGTVGPSVGWPHPFVVSAVLQLITAILVALWVQEPPRGGKEKVLEELIKSGKKYDRQLTFQGFVHAMRHNRSNALLLWQGFFTSIPWGVVFCFLNDYLSQEKGFSVPDATFMVMLFGVGTAIGGIAGGYIGQECFKRDKKYLPYFMAISTFLGILPFSALLNTTFHSDQVGYLAMAYSILGGCIASLPSVSVRPCIINVNPPETRGAALTASNLLITLGRGIGPSCITLMGSVANLSRQTALNVTLSAFWTITALQLVFLAQTLPKDQDDMEAELARYAAAASDFIASKDSPPRTTAVTDHHQPGYHSIPTTSSPLRSMSQQPNNNNSSFLTIDDGSTTMTSIEEYMTSINTFDGLAAKQSLQFVSQGIKELKEEISLMGHCRPIVCGPEDFLSSSSSSSDDEEEQLVIREEEIVLPPDEIQRRKQAWKQKVSDSAKEDTPLL